MARKRVSSYSGFKSGTFAEGARPGAERTGVRTHAKMRPGLVKKTKIISVQEVAQDVIDNMKEEGVKFTPKNVWDYCDSYRTHVPTVKETWKIVDAVGKILGKDFSPKEK